PPEASRALGEGERLLAELRFAPAADAFRRGIAQLYLAPASAAHGTSLRHAFLSLAVAESRAGRSAHARAAPGEYAPLTDPGQVVQEGYPAPFLAELKQIQQRLPGEARGELDISGSSGARVTVGGRDFGVVPIQAASVPAGRYAIRLDGADGAVWGATVE